MSIASETYVTQQPKSQGLKDMQNIKTDIKSTTNGVDTVRLKDTVEAVKSFPKLALFRFQIANQWSDGAENRSRVKLFAGQDQLLSHTEELQLAADEPEVLLGNDTAANPVEHLLHALASCVTTSIVYHAAARGISIEGLESFLEGDLDLRGFLGLDPSVRNGCQAIRLKLRIKADVSDEQLQELSALGPTFSPVFDSISRGVPIAVTAERIS